MPINQPSTNIKLTNVSLVRLRRGGKRFEVACYKNKAREWRTGVETDLDEVVQIESVFLNVSKGHVASNDDLSKAFGTTDASEVILEILQKGELQVGDKERSHELTNLWRDIATQVAQMCVEPDSQKPYTVGMIEKAMKDVHYSVKTGKSAKSQVRPARAPTHPQALEVVKLLQSKNTIPIERARMRVRVTVPTKVAKRLKEQVLALFDHVEDEDWADEWELIGTIEPGSLRAIHTLLEGEGKGAGGIETLSLAALGGEDGGDEW
ncbi:hypothetical protein MSPP1_001578 [Malassezia sp. CBS 17886]|nr:hypothetical protein MSPP1_001578 [Malassezia sp. CBS 17886]